MSQLIAYANTSQNIRRLHRCRGTGGARGHRKVPKPEHQRLCFNPLKRKIDNTRHTMFPAAIKMNSVKPLEPVQKRRTHLFQCTYFGIKPGTRQLEGPPHAHDLMRRQCARPHAALMPTAVHLCRNPDLRCSPDVKRPNTFGAINLVRREGE